MRNKKAQKKADEKVREKYSALDITFLRESIKSGYLTKDKILKVESIKSGLTPRGVRRAIRKAIQRGHADLATLLD